MLDSGSYCNFISNNLVKKLNLKPIKITNKLLVKGIRGTTKKINSYINLIFQLKILINQNFILFILKKIF